MADKTYRGRAVPARTADPLATAAVLREVGRHKSERRIEPAGSNQQRLEAHLERLGRLKGGTR